MTSEINTLQDNVCPHPESFPSPLPSPLLSTRTITRVKAQNSLTAEVLGLLKSERSHLPNIYYIKELQDLANKF